MAAPCCNGIPCPREAVELLLVSSRELDHTTVTEILRRSHWKLQEAFGLEEALAFLRDHAVPVVICESTLPDGNWVRFLEEVAQLPEPPSVIVSSRLADERLWAQVLNLGGYDLLLIPFRPEEVLRTSHLAWLSWSRTKEGRMAPLKAA